MRGEAPLSLETNIVVRAESADDLAMVRSIQEAAFGRPDEAELVERLRGEGVVLCSLIAEEQRRAVGHILFSRMWIKGPAGSLAAVSLAPVAVLPEYQRRGIGERLIRSGLDRLRGMGEQVVIVLGHPEYYQRFGFSAAKARELESPFPSDAFMALELSSGSLFGVEGRVIYPKAFGL